MKRLRPVLLVLGACLASPASAAEWVGPAPDGAIAARDLERLLAENPLAPGENIKAIVLSRNALSANLLIQVRDREPLHYHADSDITVFLLRGRGVIHVGERAFPVKAGDVLHIPRGAVHAYVNEGPEVGVALVVYSPAPGPHDRVLVDDKRGKPDR
jgi:mannose-6-phosphate isomerase-like protein (cupin superfamily)